MTTNTISEGTAHKIPADLKEELQADKKALELWEDITPLARNEFICWVEDAKQEKTRARRVTRTKEELLEGKRRPCCWVGCIHRTDKKPGAWAQKVLIEKQKK
jgi:uncharacterized protein YdeI (YjbR/CyaY-like superfamily)